MHNFKRAVLVVFALALTFGTVIFILENQQPTSLTFLGWHSPELPASIFFLGALLLGMAIGPVLGFIAYRRKAVRLKRSLLQS
ncbi:lipopolysaccharide assembly protein LapA domain-containing protein [Pseudomonas sp.]|uniref:lipopolysaccharide assembly protein LapA domain-containing protein n=1 Tax=Pseudomonas sp. TaxID=306 RepID=UPI0026308D96|nr:lipopolysaccharide assembly protein LapA domain-containing protein [Pseudomonas sp.]